MSAQQDSNQQASVVPLVRSTPMDAGMLFQPRSFGELMEYAKLIAGSGMVPECYINNPGAVIVAIQMGAEVGLGPMAALQNVAVINGRPSVWGDAGLAIVKSHPDYVDIIEKKLDDGSWVCTLKRRGETDVTRHFTWQDAQDSGLLEKKGPWQQYRTRMMQMRSRWWAMHDQFPDALRGLGSAESNADLPPRARVVDGGQLNAQPTASTANASEAQPVVIDKPRTLNDVVAKEQAKAALPKRDEEPPLSEADAPKQSTTNSKAGF